MRWIKQNTYHSTYMRCVYTQQKTGAREHYAFEVRRAEDCFQLRIILCRVRSIIRQNKLMLLTKPYGTFRIFRVKTH